MPAPSLPTPRTPEELDVIELALLEGELAVRKLRELNAEVDVDLDLTPSQEFAWPPTEENTEPLLPLIKPRAKANRENAKLSTGPVTPAGKEVSKLNATRHGLTGRQVLLPSEDAEAYTAHMERFRRDLQPTTERELELTQMLADTQWRLNRIPNLESSIFAVGRMRYAEMHKDFDPAIRDQVIDFYTLEQHARQLNNLSIQESRLRRNYAKDLAELETLQAERRKLETVPQQAERTAAAAKTATASSSSSPSGFVFSTTHSSVPPVPDSAGEHLSKTSSVTTSARSSLQKSA